MSTAWYVCPYERVLDKDDPTPTRRCSMDRFTSVIYGEGGAWSESEVAGDRAIVKVRASDKTLADIALTPGFYRFPVSDLKASLATVDPDKLQQIVTLAAAGELSPTATLGSVLEVSKRTLHGVLSDLAWMRRKPRYDKVADTIICDGPPQWVKPIEVLDGEVPDGVS